jgi:hypothetical protein
MVAKPYILVELLQTTTKRNVSFLKLARTSATIRELVAFIVVKYSFSSRFDSYSLVLLHVGSVVAPQLQSHPFGLAKKSGNCVFLRTSKRYFDFPNNQTKLNAEEIMQKETGKQYSKYETSPDNQFIYHRGNQAYLQRRV